MTKKDLKVGMVCEVEEFGKSELVMITYNKNDELCMSGKNIFGDLSKVDAQTLDYGQGEHKFLKVYGRANNPYAHELSTKGRELLWERTEYYNGKVVCINAFASDLTVGKIYTFVDGMCKTENGAVFSHRPFKSLEDLNSRLRSKFIEVVE